MLAVGSIHESEWKRKELALKSLQHCSNDKQFGVLFPEIKEEIDEKIRRCDESGQELNKY